jgi:hypothetical protein
MQSTCRQGREITAMANRIKPVLFLICIIGSGISGPSFAQKDKINMFCSDWPVWETARSMNSLGELSSEFKFLYRDYSTNVDRFKDGVADITFLTLYDFIYTQLDKQDGVVIAITDYSSGGDKIFVRNDINAPPDLKGQLWVLQSNSISAWLAFIFLRKYGLSLGDIKIRHTKGENVGTEFVNNSSATAAVGWNPNFNMVPTSIGKVMATSADFPQNIFDVIVVKRKSLEQNREIYKAFIDAWFRAVNDQKIIEQTSRNLGISITEYQGFLLNAYIYKTKTASLQIFPVAKKVSKDIVNFFNQDPPRSIATARGATQEMFKKDRQMDIEKFFDDSLLKTWLNKCNPSVKEGVK